MVHVLCLRHRYVCFELIFLSWIIYYNKSLVFTRVCEGGCCDGYIWSSKNNKCEKCMPGYKGPNCTIPCPYPLYGERCRGVCDCSNDSCDMSTGCATLTTDKSTTMGTTIETTVLEENITTFENNPSSSKHLNRILIHLIQIFGLADICLIFTYLLTYVYDKRRQKRAIQAQINIVDIAENNSVYENIDIISLSTINH